MPISEVCSAEIASAGAADFYSPASDDDGQVSVSVPQNSYSGDVPKFQTHCETKISPSLWTSQQVKSGIIPNLWEQVESKLRGELEKNCYLPGSRIEVEVHQGAVFTNGFRLHGIGFCFSEGSNVRVRFEFTVQEDASLLLSGARFIFARPILAAANLDLPFKWGALKVKFGGCLTEKTALEMANESIALPYDRNSYGDLLKPVVMAFDTVRIFPEGGGKKPGVFLELNSDEYLKKGWGTFLFATDEDACEEKGDCFVDKKKGYPGRFLGGVADKKGKKVGVCKNTTIGNLVRKAVFKWILKEWGGEYNNFTKAARYNDRLLSLAAVANLKMGMGSGGCDLPRLEEEQDSLGKF